MENKKVFIIDRFEGNWAVIEYGREMFNIPKILLPKGSKEGDVIEFAIEINKEETKNREEKIRKLTENLFQ